MSGSAPLVSDDVQLDRSSQLLDLSGALQKSGKPQEALDAAREGTDILRRMMQKDPAAYRPWFGWALMTLTLSLIDVGQGGEALANAQEAAGLYRELHLPSCGLPGHALQLSVPRGAQLRRPDHERGGRWSVPQAGRRGPRCSLLRSYRLSRQPLLAPVCGRTTR